MPQPSDDHPPYQSQYPELKLPDGGFRSTLPEHLLNGADDQMSWIMHEISRNSAATEFACRGAVDLSNHLRALNGKTNRNAVGLDEARAEIAALKTDNATLKAQVEAARPIVGTIITVKTLFSNKLFLIIFGMSVLFLLGFNRDILPAIAKYFFGG